MHSFSRLLAALTGYVTTNGIAVRERIMDVEVPGEFDGVSITLNPVHDVESRCYYLVHSFGSIVAWSVDTPLAQSVFLELRAAKETRLEDPVPFARALKPFCEFEERASEYAVWVLATLGFAHTVGEYTKFFRADAESMSILHRQGSIPVLFWDSRAGNPVPRAASHQLRHGYQVAARPILGGLHREYRWSRSSPDFLRRSGDVL